MMVDVMRADSGVEIQELRVDGGAAADDLLLQFQADLLGVPVVRPRVTETTAAQGRRILRELGVGLLRDEKDVAGELGGGEAV